MATPRPDLHPEFEIKAVPVDALVRMRATGKQYADAASVLGLGQGDLVDVTIPSFQRGLKWGRERLMEFHYSLIQGWPIGVMVLAIEGTELINSSNNQRKIHLSLIDGQQRSWALSELVGKFWTNPWFAFHSPKWDALTPASGPIVDAGVALDRLSDASGFDRAGITRVINEVAAIDGRGAFEDYAMLLDRLGEKLDGWPLPVATETRSAVRQLAAALVRQEEMLRELPVPVLLLSEALRNELPTVFRRLNEGVPLKGYDLLAATWGSSRLLPTDATLAQKKFLKQVLKVAGDRIANTYAATEDGYEYDPSLEPLELSDLSLFDLLYYLSKEAGKRRTFTIKSDVTAFQVAALCLNGQIQKVDEKLRQAFPVSDAGAAPDITQFPRAFVEALEQVELALKPMMDVTAKNLTSFRGKVGLTPAVVYISTFLTHQYLVEEPDAEGPLVLRSRGSSAAERTVRPGLVLNASDRAQRLKRNLPVWFVHDALTSVFAGSRAYEAANDRVWRAFAEGSGQSQARVLHVSNAMFEQPALDALLDAFDNLWDAELAQAKTPQRRRVSDSGAVLLRAAYADLQVHDTHIDHVIPFALGRAAAAKSGSVYPLNHVANQMPLSASVNSARKDLDWATFHATLSSGDRTIIEKCLLMSWSETSAARLVSVEEFSEYLAARFRRLVGRALNNLGLDEWADLAESERTAKLAGIALWRP
jgi:hypothetical protein